MQRHNSYHLRILSFVVSLSLSIILIDPYLTSAADEVPSDSQNQIKETQTLEVTDPQVQIGEPRQEESSIKDIPYSDDQTKQENGPPITETKEAEGGGFTSNSETSSNDETDPETSEIPIVLNKHVVNHITYFQTRMKERFTLWLSRSSRYIPMMQQILQEFALPGDLVYLSLIESGFNPNAYSRARAVGPWQFIKYTGRKYGLRIDDWVDERRHPVKSTVAAAKYLKDLFNMFGNWDLALASYNAGEGRIHRALVKSKKDDFWDIRSTRLLKRETREYVPKFMAATIIAKNPERYGFDVDYISPMLYDEVIVDSTTDLNIIARAAESSLEEIRELNPHLKKNITPPGEKDYIVHIPYGRREIFYTNFNAIPREDRLKTLRYRVKRGETLSAISRKHGIPIAILRELNGFDENKVLKEGEYIVITSFPVMPKKVIPKKKIEYASLKEDNRSREGKGDNYGFIYKVQKGDTLWDISKRFNIPVNQIKKWNGIRRGNIIKPGKELILSPDGATG